MMGKNKVIETLQKVYESSNKKCPKFLPTTVFAGCEEPARTIGRTQISLDNIRDFANQIPDNPEEKRSILIVGDPTKFGSNHLEIVKIIEELKNKKVDIVFHSTQSMSMGKITGDEILQLNQKYSHSLSDVIQDKLNDSLGSLEFLETEFVSKQNYNNKHVSQGVAKNKGNVGYKVSKKGKNNPQSGSKFHR